MVLQGKCTGVLWAAWPRQGSYDAAVVARNAGFLEVLSKMPWDGFVPSTKDVKARRC